MSWKHNLLLAEAASLALGTGLYVVASVREQDGLLDEMLFETKEERTVEGEIGVPIHLNWEDRGEERSQRVRNFASVYRETQEHWDFFEEQFSLVNRIHLRNVHAEHLATAGRNGTITVFCGNTQCLDDSSLVHELAHLRHYTLGPEFLGEWRVISGVGYYDDDEGVKNNCLEFMESVAAVTCYGAKSEFEDVAELAAFVYDINNPNTFVLGFSDPERWLDGTPQFRRNYLDIGLISESIPRIEEKIRLLQRYGFFSEEEMDTALQELEEFYPYKPESYAL